MRFPKGIAFFVLSVVFVFFFASPAHAASSKNSKNLVLKARLFSIEAFDPQNSVVDALDEASVQGALPTATVSFLVKDVLRGELPLLKKQGGSGTLSGQAKDAVQEKNILKLITMDFENPDVEHPERVRWFSVGVQSPLESFKVVSWKDLPQEPYKLTFSKASDQSGWVLKSAEKTSSR